LKGEVFPKFGEVVVWGNRSGKTEGATLKSIRTRGQEHGGTIEGPGASGRLISSKKTTEEKGNASTHLKTLKLGALTPLAE